MEINSIRVLLFVFGLILLRDIDEVLWLMTVGGNLKSTHLKIKKESSIKFKKCGDWANLLINCLTL